MFLCIRLHLLTDRTMSDENFNIITESIPIKIGQQSSNNFGYAHVATNWSTVVFINMLEAEGITEIQQKMIFV